MLRNLVRHEQLAGGLKQEALEQICDTHLPPVVLGAVQAGVGVSPEAYVVTQLLGRRDGRRTTQARPATSILVLFYVVSQQPFRVSWSHRRALSNAAASE